VLAALHLSLLRWCTHCPALSLSTASGLYILNWVYRILTEYYYRKWIEWIAGLVQTALYIDFFVHYYRAKSAAGLGADVVISGSEV
jgi:hypothetical protein